MGELQTLSSDNKSEQSKFWLWGTMQMVTIKSVVVIVTLLLKQNFMSSTPQSIYIVTLFFPLQQCFGGNTIRKILYRFNYPSYFTKMQFITNK